MLAMDAINGHVIRTLSQAAHVVLGCPNGGYRIIIAVTRTPRNAYITQNQTYPAALHTPPQGGRRLRQGLLEHQADADAQQVCIKLLASC